MATERRDQGFVYRRGALTPKNFTPRPQRDTAGREGQEPGLSTEEAIPGGEGKAQKIDVSKLKPPLCAIADDPAKGTPGHVAIVPVTGEGKVDQKLLEEWAAAREAEAQHPLTQLLLDAVVEPDIRGSS
jgi:hypothetical protein